MNGMISSLMLANTDILRGLSQVKHNSGTRQADDNFSGILQERMSAGQSTRSDKTQASAVLKESSTEATSQAQRSDRSVMKNQPVTQKQPDSVSKTETASDKVSSKEQESGEAPRQSESEDQDLTAISLVSLLLERLFARLEQLADGTQAQTDAQTGDKIENLVESLKNGLTDSIEELEKLLESLLERQTDSATQELIADFKDLLGQVKAIGEAVADKLTAAANGRPKPEIDIMVGSIVDHKELLMKLKAESRDILEKLKVKLTDLTKNTAAEAQTEEGVAEAADLMEEAESKLAGDESGEEQKTERTEVKEHHGKAGEKQPVQEMTAETKSVDNSPSEEAIPAVDVKTDAPIEVKTVKPDFQLSPKAQAQSVTQQVILKVKLMAGENKQEMEMHLKPESLGKLSLRIIHERGEILAKITAENEQVKAILESNMQLLKDALEKSGYTVQNLSVSVGDHSKDNQSQNQNQKQPERSGRLTSGRISAMDGKIEGAAIRPGYYQGMQGASRIDLTA